MTFQVKALLALLAIGLGLGLGSCGRSTTASPEEVHAEWVQALRNNDRQTLLSLAAESPYREVTVDQTLATIQEYVRNGYSTVGVNGGALQGVDVLPLAEQGQGKVGYSRWRFATVTICYGAELTPTEASWRVLQWGQEDESACETASDG
jgi:hypothetical protein